MNTAPDLMTASIKMMLSLGVVLLIVWGLYRAAKSKLPANTLGGKAKHIQIVDSQYLGVKKSVTMVKIPGSVLVLGVGVNDVNLLTRIDDPGILEGINTSPKRPRILGFKDHLQRLTKSQSQDDPDILNERAAE